MKPIFLAALAGLMMLVAGPQAKTLPRATGAHAAPELNLPQVDDQERLETILANFDRTQASIRTLEAEFSEEKNLAMLVNPLHSTGHFYYASPDQAKWEYRSPDRRVFLITHNTLMQYFPGRKLLEKKDLRAANTSRVFKLFGLGQTSKELTTFYRISLGDSDGDKAGEGSGPAQAGGSPAPEADAPDGIAATPPPPSILKGTYKLILTPRRRAVGKRISRVLLWVGDHDFLPRVMRYEEADGDVTTLTFLNVVVNAQMAQDTFQVDVPPDVEVSRKISLFSSSGGKGGSR